MIYFSFQVHSFKCALITHEIVTWEFFSWIFNFFSYFSLSLSHLHAYAYEHNVLTRIEWECRKWNECATKPDVIYSMTEFISLLIPNTTHNEPSILHVGCRCQQLFMLLRQIELYIVMKWNGKYTEPTIVSGHGKWVTYEKLWMWKGREIYITRPIELSEWTTFETQHTASRINLIPPIAAGTHIINYNY